MTIRGFIAALIVAVPVWAQTPEQKLAAHTAEFERDVIEVTDGVHVAVGYALSNSILIEGDDGVIIVDTTENPGAAREILAEFRKITDKPVKAIVYTHFHADHIAGATVFGAEDSPDVYSHRTTEALASDSYQLLVRTIQARSIRQFGVGLAAEQFLNCGIGPQLRIGATSGYIPANKVFEDELEATVAGVKMRLVHAPGETGDQLFVWLPDKKTLLPGDNFYRAFPNLYAIRGTKYRDVREWANSLDAMIALGAEHLVPSHTRPISGKEEIETRLTNYRDAIRFVHDTTVEGINQGMTPDELVEYVKLPEHLAADPWLVEYYGTVEWSVRSIFNGYLGWFDGNATNLDPLNTKERAERMRKMLGGGNVLFEKAKEAHEGGDHQWAAELADLALALAPDDTDAKLLKAECLFALGQQQISANGRNYYMVSGRQLGGTPPDAPK